VTQRNQPRQLGGVYFAIACLLVVTVAPAATENSATSTDLLAPQRWREHSFGLSLRPPLGAQLTQRTADDAILQITTPDQASIRVYIKNTTVDLQVPDIVTKAIHQLGGVHPSATILEQSQLQIAQHPAAVIYFHVPGPKRTSWVIGQAFLQINLRAFVMLKLEVDRNQFDLAQPVFDAVIHTLELQDPDQLNRLRTQQIAQAQAWLETIDTNQLHQAIHGELWLRIIEGGDEGGDQGGKDIGYKRVSTRITSEMDLPGLRVDIQTRVYHGSYVYDSLSNFFVSDDNTHEIWSIRTTARPANPHAPVNQSAPSQKSSLAQTGLRSNDTITLTNETPTGIHQHTWQRPEVGYISQAQLHLLGQLLSPPVTSELGFYAYHPDTQKITFQTQRVIAAPDGSYAIHSRPTPQLGEQVSYYDAQGHLLKHQLPDGRVLLPTTRPALAVRWKLD